MSAQVAAVHCRNVHRMQGLQGMCVVPVIEVPLEFCQARHCPQGIRRALDEGTGRKVTEVVGRQIREQRKPHIGRRGAMSDADTAILLIVIGRQPMIFRPDQGIEVAPSLAGYFPEKIQLVCGKPSLAASDRLTDPPGDGGRDPP